MDAEEVPTDVGGSGGGGGPTLPSPSSSSLPLLAGLLLVVAVVVFALRYVQTSDKGKAASDGKSGKGGKGAARGGGPDNKVVLNPQADAAYLANSLRPDSTPFDVLYAIATSPDTVAVTSKHLSLAADLREKKRAHLAKEKEAEKTHQNMDDILADDGWAEDDDDDEAAKAARKAKEEKEKEAARLAKATGKDTTDMNRVKLEGIDDGVLGQEWVTRNLTEAGAWPPPRLEGSLVADRTFDDGDGNEVGPMDHPAIRRNLVMTMGRLNARRLNTHPELVAAGPKKLIDPTYFQATMEYRQRVGGMLEAALRMACTLRCYRLACAVLDAIVMFKIGLMDVDDDEQKKWFGDLMAKQYGSAGTPGLVLQEKFLGVPTPDPPKDASAAGGKGKTDAEKKEAEKNRIAREIMQTRQVTTTDEKMALEMQITRRHAEAFTKEKLAMAQRQGVPPQMALQAYREAWFILVRARRVEGEEGGGGSKDDDEWDGALGAPGTGHPVAMLREKKDPLFGMLEPATVAAFEEEFANAAANPARRIVLGWPFVISNVAQKTGKVKMHLPPPLEAGRYEFDVTIKSQEFLAVGEEFTLTVDVAKGTGKKEKEEEEEAEEEAPKEDDESKKDK